MSYGYFVKARLWPTIITAFPLLVFANRVIRPLYSDSLQAIYAALPYVADLGLSAALVYLAVHINRFLAKEIFQRLYFQEELKMPSTEFLLWKNSFYTTETKVLLHQRIQNQFGMALLSPTDELQDENKARNLITVAVSQIRNNLRGNRMLLQHNIEYGFVRNLLGGCVQAVIFSAIITVFAYSKHNYILITTGLIMMGIYLLPIIISNWIIKRYGRYYAKVLLEQFLSN